VDAAALHQRHKLTPYAGRKLAGRVRRTYVRGELAFAGGAHAEAKPGRLL
jgi:dihydroorotase-like cyclic amidohydrolase